MPLALFDLDNTLIDGDSDHLWGEFMVANNLVAAQGYKQQNDAFYNDYKAGNLDIVAYQRFCLAPLAQWTKEELTALHTRFMEEHIIPIIKPQTRSLIRQHEQRGDKLVVITATNRFVTGPIVDHLAIPTIIATEPEVLEGRYTGNIIGTPCFQAGKITRLEEWVATQPQQYSISDSYFYSDSINDLPLLQCVKHPIVIDGDKKLIAYAKEHNWQVTTLR